MFVVGRLVYLFKKNKDKEEPDIGPPSAESHDHITSPDPAKETGNDDKGKNQQHDRHKSDNSVDAIDPLKGF
jgi:hypothetical protein